MTRRHAQIMLNSTLRLLNDLEAHRADGTLDDDLDELRLRLPSNVAYWQRQLDEVPA